MELLTVKIIALTLLGVFSLFFGLLPLRLRKALAKGTKRRERIVSCLLCFGGGVLLATVFTHMLPETREGFAKAAPEATYPLAEVVICAGFFLIYFVEEFVHKVGDVIACWLNSRRKRWIQGKVKVIYNVMQRGYMGMHGARLATND